MPTEIKKKPKKYRIWVNNSETVLHIYWVLKKKLNKWILHGGIQVSHCQRGKSEKFMNSGYT